MKIFKLASSALLMTLLCTTPVRAELPGVKVHVTGFSSITGTVEVSLFNSAETFLQEPYLQESGKVAENRSFEIEFVALPEGDYAVVVVHDANDNSKLDTGFLGIGGEDYGFSNNVRPWFGRPVFDQVKFIVDQPGKVMEIELD